MERFSERKIILGLICLQLLICLPFIDSYPVDLDEPFTIFWSQQDLDEMLTMFRNENNPPLHFFLLHFWIKIFGIGPVAVRSLSLIFSVLTIPVLFKLGKKVKHQNLGFLVCLFFIF